MKDVGNDSAYKSIYERLFAWYAQFDQEDRDLFVELVCHGFVSAAYFRNGSAANSPLEYEQIADVCDIADMFLVLQAKQSQ